jgi:hypothetical protein
MAPTDLQFPDDLEALIERLDKEPLAPSFALPSNLALFHKAKGEDKVSRRGIKKLIHPDNARFLLPHLPLLPDDRTHAILRGDFVLCDLIPMILEHCGRCDHIHIATLGLSAANAEQLAQLVARNLIGQITLAVSHYFAQVDKTTTYREVVAKLEGIAQIITTRTHAKVICLPTASGHFVIEGSANLRSSDNTEQIVIFNDPDLLAWHARWMESLATV